MQSRISKAARKLGSEAAKLINSVNSQVGWAYLPNIKKKIKWGGVPPPPIRIKKFKKGLK